MQFLNLNELKLPIYLIIIESYDRLALSVKSYLCIFGLGASAEPSFLLISEYERDPNIIDGHSVPVAVRFE